MTNSSPPNQSHSAGELIRAGVWLTVAVAICLPASVWWGHEYAGQSGVLAAAVAAGLCWLGSLLAVFVRTLFSKPQDAVSATLGAMLARMIIVLGGALAIGSTVPSLAEAAFGGQVIVFFLLTLAVETVLAVRWVQSLQSEGAKPGREENPSRSGNQVEVV